MFKTLRNPLRNSLVLIFSCLLLSGCETVYYDGMEQLGIHKRDILIDRIEEAQESQEDAQEQFKDALEQFRSVAQFDGGDLEDMYNKLNDEYEDSVSAAEDISDRVDSVEDVAEDLFKEWNKENGEYTSASLRKDSEKKLKSTRRQYEGLLRSMRSAEKTVEPVLATLKDQVLYLKHNLNARAIASLKGELQTVNADVDRLINAMQKSINESKSFIAQMQDT